MKKYIATLVLGLASLGANAQQAQNGITFTDDAITIDMNKACYSQKKFARCDLSDYGIGLVFVGSGSQGSFSQYSANYGMYSQSKITSSIPIVKVDWTCEAGYGCGSARGNVFSGSDSGAATVVFDAPGTNEMTFATAKASYPTRIYLATGIPTFLKQSFTNVGSILKTTYTGVLRNVNGFKNEIAKSHRGHLDRFTDALSEGIALLDAKDAKGVNAYSVLDWRVQENARLVVVFGSVLNELLSDYDDVARLQTSIKSMRVLVDQLRQTYGWNNGLAGTVSKASASLIEVVRLELQELASIKMAMGSGDFQIYLDLLKTTRSLQAKVNASKSGDMKAQREIFDMVDQWNGKAWQDEMARLMNAGPDFKNLVIPKLSMLLYSIESISDLSDQEFIIPDRALLNTK